jgi:predicted ATPase/DNA-binding SARP family transcriptional activator
MTGQHGVDAMVGVEVSLLGPVEATRSGRAVDLGGPQQRALLALLALRAGRVVPVGSLIDALWPESPPASAGKVVQTYVSRLRKTLGEEAIERRGAGYLLRLAPEAVDLVQFERLSAEGRFAEALALWRGPALADLAGLPRLQAEAERLEELRLQALEERIEADLDAGADAELVAELQALVAEQPLRERPRGLLMRALYRSGRQAEALAVYQQGRRLLVDELGIEPSAELRELHAAVLNQDPLLVRATAVSGPSRVLPSGTVTLLFTDVEGSTKVLHELGADAYAEALAEHRRVLREAFGAHGGVEVDTQGDAFFVAFPTASGALLAAAQAQRGLEPGPIRVRMGVHTGTPLRTDEGYVGVDVHRAARLAASGHGGQLLVSAATAPLVAPAGLRDLGEHRLQDSAASERVYQFGDHEFPPLRSLHQTNLPIPSTPFLGRERELAELRAVLTQTDVRLLTLTGAGGMGKTRLGLRLADGLADNYRDGVWWVSLADLRDPALVLESAARVLGAKRGLADHIADRSMLLVFDNFEHVIDAAPEVAALLARCPHLDLLVTSRELLRVPGEHAYDVPPLESQEASELFLARARAVEPGFRESAAVTALCSRLENLPLALELAAARVRVLSIEQLVERLSSRLDLLKGGRGLDSRQQTLRATLDWSHELLTPEEQALLARLAVFRGGWTLAASEEVAAADLDTLHSLVDKSLLRRDHDRYWMLETIREYAAERLDARTELDGGGEASLCRRRHARHYLILVEEAKSKWNGPEHAVWIARLQAEHDNLRAATVWFLEAADAETAITFLYWGLWGRRGYVSEGRQLLAQALELVGDEPAIQRFQGLRLAFVLALMQGDRSEAQSRAEEANAISRLLGRNELIALSLVDLGVLASEEGDREKALRLLQEAERMFRDVGDERGLARGLNNLAHLALMNEDYERAAELSEEVLRLQQRVGDLHGTGIALLNRGEAALKLGSLQKSRAAFREALVAFRDLGDVHATTNALDCMAITALIDDNPVRAARLLAAAASLRERIGAVNASSDTMDVTTALSDARKRLSGTAFSAATAAGSTLTLEDAVNYALSAD